MADYSTEITYLESVLNGAVTEVSMDGARTKTDLDAARQRLAELRALDDASQAAAMVRPTIFSIKTGGAF